MTNVKKVADILIKKGEISSNITTQIDMNLGRQLSAIISRLRKYGLEIYTKRGEYEYTKDVVYILVDNPQNEKIYREIALNSLRSAIALAKRKITEEERCNTLQ